MYDPEHLLVFPRYERGWILLAILSTQSVPVREVVASVESGNAGG